MNTQEQYDIAYSKIMDWVYENAPNNIDTKMDIDFPHDVYVHRALRIYPNKKVTIVSGSWGWCFDEEYELISMWSLYEGLKVQDETSNRFYRNKRDKSVRLLVDSWHTYMKPAVEKAFGKYQSVYNFEA